MTRALYTSHCWLNVIAKTHSLTENQIGIPVVLTFSFSFNCCGVVFSVGRGGGGGGGVTESVTPKIRRLYFVLINSVLFNHVFGFCFRTPPLVVILFICLFVLFCCFLQSLSRHITTKQCCQYTTSVDKKKHAIKRNSQSVTVTFRVRCSAIATGRSNASEETPTTTTLVGQDLKLTINKMALERGAVLAVCGGVLVHLTLGTLYTFGKSVLFLWLGA